MALKLDKIVQAQLVLNELVKRDEKDSFLPFRTRLKVSTILRKIQGDAEFFDKERDALIRKYGEEAFDLPAGEPNRKSLGIAIKPNTPAFESFQRDLSDLLDQDSNVEAIKPLEISDLGDNNPLSIGFLRQMEIAGILKVEDVE